MITSKSYQRMITVWRAGRSLKGMLDAAIASNCERRANRAFILTPRPEAATIGRPKARPGRRMGH